MAIWVPWMSWLARRHGLADHGAARATAPAFGTRADEKR
jgi:hypothetical protein